MPAIPLVYASDGINFRATYQAECGTSSGVVNRAFLNVIPTWGGVSVQVTCLDGRGGATTRWNKDIANNILDGIEVPSGTRALTVEGKAESANTIVAVRLVELAK
jgi:hypothetical protein